MSTANRAPHEAVVYVDGHNLYHGLRRRFGRKYLWLDLSALAQQMRQDDYILTVRYYTAIVKGEPDAARRQEIYLAALAAHRTGSVNIRRPDGSCRRPSGAGTAASDGPADARHRVSIGPMKKSTRTSHWPRTWFGTRPPGWVTRRCWSRPTPTSIRRSRRACSAPHRRIFIAYPLGRHSPRNDFDGRVTAYQIPEEHFAAAQLPELVNRGGRSYRRPDKWR